MDTKPLETSKKWVFLTLAFAVSRIFYDWKSCAASSTPLLPFSLHYLSGRQHDAGVRSKQKNASNRFTGLNNILKPRKMHRQVIRNSVTCLSTRWRGRMLITYNWKRKTQNFLSYVTRIWNNDTWEMSGIALKCSHILRRLKIIRVSIYKLEKLPCLSGSNKKCRSRRVTQRREKGSRMKETAQWYCDFIIIYCSNCTALCLDTEHSLKGYMCNIFWKILMRWK